MHEDRSEWERSKRDVVKRLDSITSDRLRLAVVLSEYVRMHATEGDSVAIDLVRSWDALHIEDQCATLAGEIWCMEQEGVL